MPPGTGGGDHVIDRFRFAASMFMWFREPTVSSFPLYYGPSALSPLLLPPSPISPSPYLLSPPPALISGDLPRAIPPYPTTDRPCPPRLSTRPERGIPPGQYSPLSPSDVPVACAHLLPSPSVDQPITSSTWIRIHPLRISHHTVSPHEFPALTLLNCIPGRSL